MSIEMGNPARADQVFRFEGYGIDPLNSQIRCSWRIGDHCFAEEFHFPGGVGWDRPEVIAAVELLYILSGVSYYKTLAPATIDLGGLALPEESVRFVERYYKDGLGEFAFRADEGHRESPVQRRLEALNVIGHREALSKGSTDRRVTTTNPLVPFGGGVDSIVSVELLKRAAVQPTLFIVSRGLDEFTAVESPARATELPIIRAYRYLDPQVLDSSRMGFLNGHVPVTGIISAMALVAASLFGFDAVVMSNEWSSSSPTMSNYRGVGVNHQYSKSFSFEKDFSAVALDETGIDYYSLLRPRSELWIASYFAENCSRYFEVFCSCNRAFILDVEKRSDGWCTTCDKCAFVDLILAPFLPKKVLERIFRGHEPLNNEELHANFESLVGLNDRMKPWECVGDIQESRVALVQAARRANRAADEMVQNLSRRITLPYGIEPEILKPFSHAIPERYIHAAGLV